MTMSIAISILCFDIVIVPRRDDPDNYRERRYLI